MLPECEILRAWPSEWEYLSLYRGAPDVVLPLPSRFLHPALEVQTKQGRGRCLVTTAAVRAGDLLLADAPLAIAISEEMLVEEVCKRASEGNECQNFRKLLLGFSGSSGSEGTASNGENMPKSLAEQIVRRNYCVVDHPTQDGQFPQGEHPCGLWPVGALVNHGMRPNATRTFVGHILLYRSIKDLSAGEEVLVNYLDPRLPRAKRAELLQDAHSISDQGPDGLDSPDAITEELAKHFQKAERLMKRGQLEDAFKLLLKATNQCNECGIQDPAFTDAFRGFADVAGLLGGGASLQLEGLAMALEHATGREPYSEVSCQLSVKLLNAAMDELPASEWRRIEDIAREHVRHVHGPEPRVFDALNPTLAQRLAALAATEAAEPQAVLDAAEGSEPQRTEKKRSPDAGGAEAEEGTTKKRQKLGTANEEEEAGKT